MERHDLVYVRPHAWRSLLASWPDLPADPLVAQWAANGWPLVARRPMPGEGDGVPLGVPLPLSAGKRRLMLNLPAHAIISTSPPPLLRSVIRQAPGEWGPTLHRLRALFALHAVEARVFGSLAWEAITGLAYVSARSDLDLLMHVGPGTDLRQLAHDLAGIEAEAPMRLDGELVRNDGAAVNWRELHDGRGEAVLAKTMRGVVLLDQHLFTAHGAP
jgi:phosphoribosyl-dephospho-CoA transferase